MTGNAQIAKKEDTAWLKIATPALSGKTAVLERTFRQTDLQPIIVYATSVLLEE